MTSLCPSSSEQQYGTHPILIISSSHPRSVSEKSMRFSDRFCHNCLRLFCDNFLFNSIFSASRILNNSLQVLRTSCQKSSFFWTQNAHHALTLSISW